MEKKKNRKNRRAVTLIEMIVVMLLIATITGALAYNYNASLNEGKSFRTKEGIARIQTILSIAAAENPEMDTQQIADKWKYFVTHSPMAGKGNELLKDGWGKEYEVEPPQDDSGDFKVVSQSYNTYKEKRG